MSLVHEIWNYWKTEESLQDVNIGNDFLTRTPITHEIRIRTEKWDGTKLKSFCTAKEITTRVKRIHRVGENLCQLFMWKGINIQLYLETKN
jgi:hypothetical protein